MHNHRVTTAAAATAEEAEVALEGGGMQVMAYGGRGEDAGAPTWRGPLVQSGGAICNRSYASGRIPKHRQASFRPALRAPEQLQRSNQKPK